MTGKGIPFIPSNRFSILVCMILIPLLAVQGNAQTSPEKLPPGLTDLTDQVRVLESVFKTSYQQIDPAALLEIQTEVEGRAYGEDANQEQIPAALKLLSRVKTLAGCYYYRAGDRAHSTRILMTLLQEVNPSEIYLDGSIASQAEALFFEELKSKNLQQIIIHSSPENSRVFVNGREIGVTPIDNAYVMKGMITLAVEHPGHDRYSQEIEIKGSREPIAIHPILTKNTASVKISTIPGGVEVYLDGKFVGTTPEQQIPDNDVPSYESGSSTMDGGSSHTASRPMVPKPVRISGKFLVLDFIPLGKHVVDFRKACYRSKNHEINLELGDWALEDWELERAFGKLHVTGDEPLTLILDGERIGSTPYRKDKVCVGDHILEARRGALTVWFQNFTLEPEQEMTFHAETRPILTYAGCVTGDPDLEITISKNIRTLLNKHPGISFRNDTRIPEFSSRTTPLLSELLQINATNPIDVPWNTFMEQIRSMGDLADADLVSIAFVSRETDRRFLVVLNTEISVPDIYVLEGSGESLEFPANLYRRFDNHFLLNRTEPGFHVVDYLTGVMITDIAPDSPAIGAGLLLGDLIVSINETPVTSVNGFQNFLDSEKPQDLQIKVIRGRSELTVSFRTHESPVMAPVSSPDYSYQYILALLSRTNMTGIKQNPALLNIGIAYLSLGDPEQALEKGFMPCELAESAGVSWGTVLYFKGLAQNLRGHNKAAQQDFKNAAVHLNARFLNADGPFVAPLARYMAGEN